MDVMNEILIDSLMQELHTALTAMQERTTELIGRVTEEIVLGRS